MKLFVVPPLLLAFALTACTPPAPPLGAPAAPGGCNCSMTSIIFFDPGSAALSAKNLAAVQQDANFFAKQIPHPVIITGGADTAEAERNPSLSWQRANAVATQLEADGVPAADLIVTDAGTQHLMIPTGAGVPQLMNRYVMTRIQVAPAVPAGPYQMQSIVLYQPNAMLVARLGPNGARPLANYIKQINASLAALFTSAPPQPGVTAALVVGIKPGGAVRTWIVAPTGAVSPTLAAQIQSAAQAVPPPVVQNGPVAFAMIFNAWGGGAPIADARHPVPMPQAWTQGAPGPELVPDGVFTRIWP